MAVKDPIGTISVTGDDIRDTINNYGGVADNNLLSFFDSLDDINKWSKWKPFSYPANFVDDENILKGVHWGLQIDHMSNWGQVTTKWQTQYVYNKPNGTANSPFRGGDFRNYTKSAVCFFNRFELEDSIIYAGNTGAFNVWFNSPSSGSIKLSDIVVNGITASDCYFGVVAVKDGTTNYYVITDSYKAGANTQFGVEVKFSTAYEKWKVYPMLSSTKITTLTLNPINPSCVLCLPSAPITVDVRPTSELYLIAISNLVVTARAGKIQTRMDVTLKNNGSSARTFNVSYKVQGVDSSGNIEELVAYKSIISQSVASKATATVAVNQTANATSDGWSYFIVTIKDTVSNYETSADTYNP